VVVAFGLGDAYGLWPGLFRSVWLQAVVDDTSGASRAGHCPCRGEGSCVEVSMIGERVFGLGYWFRGWGDDIEGLRG
jgi:hypothetical protein